MLEINNFWQFIEINKISFRSRSIGFVRLGCVRSGNPLKLGHLPCWYLNAWPASLELCECCDSSLARAWLHICKCTNKSPLDLQRCRQNWQRVDVEPPLWIGLPVLVLVATLLGLGTLAFSIEEWSFWCRMYSDRHLETCGQCLQCRLLPARDNILIKLFHDVDGWFWSGS